MKSRQNANFALTATFVAVGVIIASLSGCGPSREQQALNNIRNMPKPAYIRVLNTTASPIKLVLKNGQQVGKIAPDSVNQFIPISAKTKDASISGSANFSVSDLALQSNLGQTIVPTSASAYVLSKPEPVYTKGNSPEVTVVNTTSKDVSIDVSGQKVSVTAQSNSNPIEVSVGNVDAKMGSSSASTTAETATAYSCFIVSEEGKLKLIFARNTQPRTPNAGGRMAKA